MEQVILLNKNVSETPLECLERFRGEHPEYANVKMTYAGRLDPMASGLLVVLAGDMVHKKEEFLNLSKTYEATIVLGIESDTFDCLGLVWNPPLHKGRWHEALRVTEGSDVIETLNSFIGTYSQTYPAYSSKTVNGKQLHSITRSHFAEPSRDRAPLILPTHMVTVEGISNIHVQEISVEELVHDVIPKIKAVTGDFRQEEIIKSWENLGSYPLGLAEPRPLPLKGGDNTLTTVSFTISVSGGTYIRAIADELGKKLGTGAVLWKLRRTRVGDYSLSIKHM